MQPNQQPNTVDSIHNKKDQFASINQDNPVKRFYCEKLNEIKLKSDHQSNISHRTPIKDEKCLPSPISCKMEVNTAASPFSNIKHESSDRLLNNYHHHHQLAHNISRANTSSNVSLKNNFRANTSSAYSIDDILSNTTNSIVTTIIPPINEKMLNSHNYTENTYKKSNELMANISEEVIDSTINVSNLDLSTKESLKTYVPLVYVPQKLDSPSYQQLSNNKLNVNHSKVATAPSTKNTGTICDNRDMAVHSIDNPLSYSLSNINSYKTAVNDSKTIVTPICSDILPCGQSLKVASSFEQAKLHASIINSVESSNSVAAIVNNQNEKNLSTINNNTEPNEHTLTEVIPSATASVPTEDQFKPMDCGFKRVIVRSKYGSETKVLKKFVIYIAPTNNELELRSKRDVARFLKSNPQANYALTPENFNFDNTIHFDIKTRTISKVPRLKKSNKSIELIINKQTNDSNCQEMYYSIDEKGLELSTTNSCIANLSVDDDLNSSNIIKNNDNDSSHSKLESFEISDPQSKVSVKKRGRPKGATSKLALSSKPKKLKSLDLTSDANTATSNVPLSVKSKGKKSKKYMAAHGDANSPSLSNVKMKGKKEKHNSIDNSNKYVKVPKKTFDDRVIEHPHTLPTFPPLLLNDDLLMIANFKDIKNKVLANLVQIFEFISEFSLLLPTNNRLTVVPPFNHIIRDIIGLNVTKERYTVLDHVNSPFVLLCDCLLDYYLTQKQTLPSILYDIKLEFDIQYKYNSINIGTIIRLLIEQHLASISHLKHASKLGFNVDLCKLVDKLKTTSSILNLDPLLKSTLALFVINLLTRTPTFLSSIERMMENFTITRGARWNIEGFMRKLKRHMSVIKANTKKILSPNKTNVSKTLSDNLLSSIDNDHKITDENNKPDTDENGNDDCSIKNETTLDLNGNNPNSSNIANTTKCDLENTGSYHPTENQLPDDMTVQQNTNNRVDDTFDDNSIDEDDYQDDDEDDEHHLSSKKLAKNKSSGVNGANDSTLPSNISDEALLEALNFDAHSVKLPNTIEDCVKLYNEVDSKQKILKEWSFAFFRRLKGLPIGQDRFSRYYSMPYHSSSIFVEHNVHEIEFDNFINNDDSGHQSATKTVNNGPCSASMPNKTTEEIETTTSTLLSDNKNNIEEIKCSINNATVESKPLLSITDSINSIYFIESLNDLNRFSKCLNLVGMRERLLSKQISRNMKNMSKNTLTNSNFQKYFSMAHESNESFCVINSNHYVNSYYGDSIERVILLQYNQFFDIIRTRTSLNSNELDSLSLDEKIIGCNFVKCMKSTLVSLIELLDSKGLIVLVKKAKTNSKESKSRYVKSLLDFIDKITCDCCSDLELVLTSLQLNVSIDVSIQPTISTVVNGSPFNNRCCFSCHLNVNLDSLVTCMYCYVTYHSYCQGYDKDVKNIVEDEWSCNHCKSLICAEGINLDLTICPECNTCIHEPPRPVDDDDDDDDDEKEEEEEDNGDIEDIVEGESNSDTTAATNNNIELLSQANGKQFSASEYIPNFVKCSLCLYCHHVECVDEKNIVDKSSDFFFCPTCSEACRVSKAIAESGRKRISKKFKLEVIEMFLPCHKVLNELLKHPCADDFTRPVDLDQNPLYAHIIKKPMDLIQVRKNLLNLEYTSQDEFLADVRLIFENCKRFNQCDSQIYISGRKMAYFFENRWNHIISKLMPQDISE